MTPEQRAAARERCDAATPALVHVRGMLTEQCSRLKNGKCYTAKCLVRGGYIRGSGSYDPDIATCEEYEIATALDAFAIDLPAALAEIERLENEAEGWRSQLRWYRKRDQRRSALLREHLAALEGAAMPDYDYSGGVLEDPGESMAEALCDRTRAELESDDG